MPWRRHKVLSTLKRRL